MSIQKSEWPSDTQPPPDLASSSEEPNINHGEDTSNHDEVLDRTPSPLTATPQAEPILRSMHPTLEPRRNSERECLASTGDEAVIDYRAPLLGNSKRSAQGCACKRQRTPKADSRTKYNHFLSASILHASS